MQGYGQFCPLALTAEVVGERWTPLILREMIQGARRFNDIHRGMPRMSPSLLARRLKVLAEVGILIRKKDGRRIEYVLTQAGAELGPIVHGLSAWGMTWFPATLSREHADPDLIMWDLHRRMDLSKMPKSQTVVCFSFSDQPKKKMNRWIVGNCDGVALCITDPGFDVDIFVSTDSWTMAKVWYGAMSFNEAMSAGCLVLDGPRRLCAEFPNWLLLSGFAAAKGRLPLRAA